MACEAFGILPARPAVDPTGSSADEADRLCRIPNCSQAMQSVTERWYSADLQVVVKSLHTDPRFGQTVYQLTNIRRGEQPSPLFEVPAEYTTTTGSRGSKMTQ